MRSDSNRLSVLAQRAGAGNLAAQSQLRHELEPQLAYVVRRVLREGEGRSSLDRRILVEAERIGLTAESVLGAEGEFLVREVARSVCGVVLAGLKPSAGRRQALQETVCA